MFNLFKKKKYRSTFLDLLIKSKYFEFTDKDKVEELQDLIQSHYARHKLFITIYDENSIPICKKKYSCDSETVFEAGGYKTHIQDMRDGLEKITNYSELINTIPESFDYKSNPDARWKEGVIDFTKRINNYLVNTGSKYKCYPAYGGNDGTMYILSEPQYELLHKAITDEHSRPMSLDAWQYRYSQKSTRQINDGEHLSQFKVGMRIKHLKFGVGEIINIDERYVATIRFKKLDNQDKRIMLQYARLEIMS